MAGVTEAGFIPKRFNEVISSLQANARPLFQDLVKPDEEVNTGDTSTLGRLIGLVALDLDEVWQALEQVYQAFDPNSATGVALDNIVQYMGVGRQVGRPTVLRASVWGQVGTNLPQGQVIRGSSPERFSSTTSLQFNTEDIIGFSVSPTSIVVGQVCSVTFATDEGVYVLTRTITPGDTMATVVNDWLSQWTAFGLAQSEAWVQDSKLFLQVKSYYSYIVAQSLTNSFVYDTKKRLTFNSENFGDISAPINTVTTILTPVFGWANVSNEISAEKGSLEEDDETLRERFRVSKAVRAGNMADALYSRLREVEGVQYVRVYENMTDLVDALGIPPHSYLVVVRGGIDTELAEIVWANKPLGIASDGNTSVIIRDSQNIERVVKISRPVDVPIYVNVTVKKVGGTFPSDGADQIRDALVEYISATAGAGLDIIYTRLFTPINTVPGHQVDDLKIGTSLVSMGTTNLTVGWNEYPIIAPENISVTVLT